MSTVTIGTKTYNNQVVLTWGGEPVFRFLPLSPAYRSFLSDEDQIDGHPKMGWYWPQAQRKSVLKYWPIQASDPYPNLPSADGVPPSGFTGVANWPLIAGPGIEQNELMSVERVWLAKDNPGQWGAWADTHSYPYNQVTYRGWWLYNHEGKTESWIVENMWDIVPVNVEDISPNQRTRMPGINGGP